MLICLIIVLRQLGRNYLFPEKYGNFRARITADMMDMIPPYINGAYAPILFHRSPAIRLAGSKAIPSIKPTITGVAPKAAVKYNGINFLGKQK